MKNIYNLFKLLRGQNLIIGFLSVALSCVLLEYTINHFIILCCLGVITIMAFGNIMNDIIDINIDKINHSERVLVNKGFSLTQAKRIRNILFIGIVCFSFFINFNSKLFLYFLVIPLLILYNIYLKRMPIIGNMVVSFLLGSVFIFTELVFNNSIMKLIIPALLAFNLSLIRESIKDLQDYKGDLSENMKTLPIIIGIKKTCYTLSIFIVFNIIIFLLPYYFGIYNILYLITLVMLIQIPLLYSIYILMNFQNQKTFRYLTKVYKILSINGLLVIYSTTWGP